jgi:hypothetical protein
MTQSFLCYRVLRVAKHPWCHGEDLPQPVHLPRGHHRLRQDLGHLQVSASGVLPQSCIQVSLLALLPHRRVKGIGHHRCYGDLYLGGRHHRLWIAFVEDTTASTYDLCTTHGKISLCKNRFHMFTWLLRIPNTFIYMSIRVAQDHNKTAAWDTTSSMPSWSRREDPAATTQHRSFSFICILNCLELSNLLSWVVDLISLSIIVNLNVLLLCIYSYIFCQFWRFPVRGGSQIRQ